MKKKKKLKKKFWKKKIENFEKFFWIFFYIKGSGVREGKKPEVRNPDISKFAGLPDRTWCPVEPYKKLKLLSFKYIWSLFQGPGSHWEVWFPSTTFGASKAWATARTKSCSGANWPPYTAFLTCMDGPRTSTTTFR